MIHSTRKDLLVVFAAGNCGDDTVDEELGDKCDDIGDDGGSVLSPAQAKNVVAVGSSENGGAVDKDIDTVSYFSSKGPTVDGRIKPDVVAPGDPVWSAWADPTGESCEFDTQTVSDQPPPSLLSTPRTEDLRTAKRERCTTPHSAGMFVRLVILASHWCRWNGSGNGCKWRFLRFEG